MCSMFEPHEDRRELTSRAPGRVAALLGFVLGFGIGWLVWAALVLPALRTGPSVDNPSGDPTEWLYYGSLVVCLVLALFVVAVLGEWLERRRQGVRKEM